MPFNRIMTPKKKKKRVRFTHDQQCLEPDRPRLPKYFEESPKSSIEQGLPLGCKNVLIDGDRGCGKSSLLKAFATNKDEGKPPVIVSIASDGYCRTAYRHRQYVEDAYVAANNGSRRMCFSKADVIVVCFSVGAPDALENVPQKWMAEIRRNRLRVPVVLVAMKTDLRFEHESLTSLAHVPVYPGVGQELATSIGACDYLECSVKWHAGVQDVFHVAYEAALNHERNQLKRCFCAIM